MITKQLDYWSNLTWREFIMSLAAYVLYQLWIASKSIELFF